MTTLSWPTPAVEQLTEHWNHQLRPRLDGLTDDEYHWEPAAGAWGVRPRGTSTAPVAAGSGAWTVDFAFTEPTPPPVTTIAWRLAHVIVGLFGVRNAAHFGAEPVDYAGHDYAGTAAVALEQLDAGYAGWIEGVSALRPDEWSHPVGPDEGPLAGRAMAALVLHLTREVVHHGAEIALLRDLWRATAR